MSSDKVNVEYGPNCGKLQERLGSLVSWRELEAMFYFDYCGEDGEAVSGQWTDRESGYVYYAHHERDGYPVHIWRNTIPFNTL